MASISTVMKPLSGDPFVDGLIQGGYWTFGTGPPVLTFSLHQAENVFLGSWDLSSGLAVANALIGWSSVANIDFEYDDSAPIISSPFTATSDFAFVSTGILLSLLNPITFGLASFPTTSSGNDILSLLGLTRLDYPNPEGDVFIDTLLGDFLPGERGFYVMLHETGHALGLKHPHDDGGTGRPTFDQLGIGLFDTSLWTVMSYDALETGLYPVTPMPGDILAIQELYGPNMSYHAGNDVYTLADDGIIWTIWDAGGEDTINASGLLAGESIDLSESISYIDTSRIYPSITAIAYGVTIENAIGTGFDDVISGNSASNNLVGNGGNDTLDGGTGSDTLIGGAGDDAYFVDVAGDVVTESANEGIDTVSASVTFILGTNLENLTIMGSSAIDGTGNGLVNEMVGNDAANELKGKGGDDSLTGNKGPDILRGGGGADTLLGNGGADTFKGGGGADKLTGGAGKDTFIFNVKLGSGNVDTINGFSHADDTINLDDDIFKTLVMGSNHVLSVAQYKENTTGNATDADDRIIYNNSTGELYYDPDGNGPAAAVKFAVIDGGPDSVDQTDFTVVI